MVEIPSQCPSGLACSNRWEWRKSLGSQKQWKSNLLLSFVLRLFYLELECRKESCRGCGLVCTHVPPTAHWDWNSAVIYVSIRRESDQIWIEFILPWNEFDFIWHLGLYPYPVVHGWAPITPFERLFRFRRLLWVRKDNDVCIPKFSKLLGTLRVLRNRVTFVSCLSDSALISPHDESYETSYIYRQTIVDYWISIELSYNFHDTY